jgi:hypothetical protein
MLLELLLLKLLLLRVVNETRRSESIFGLLSL